jgi:hypothetical protein
LALSIKIRPHWTEAILSTARTPPFWAEIVSYPAMGRWARQLGTGTEQGFNRRLSLIARFDLSEK